MNESYFRQNFMGLLGMKQDNPGMGLCMLTITEHGDMLPKSDYSFKWLNDRIRCEVNDLCDHDHHFGFEGAKQSEQGYRDQALKLINGRNWSWALVMPVDRKTDIQKFCHMFLFAHDVLRHTLPVVCMSHRYWDVFKKEANPETIGRLVGHVHIADETDTLMLNEIWRIGDGCR